MPPTSFHLVVTATYEFVQSPEGGVWELRLVDQSTELKPTAQEPPQPARRRNQPITPTP